MTIARVQEHQDELVNAIVLPVSHCDGTVQIVQTVSNKLGTESMVVVSCPRCKQDYYITSVFRPMGEKRGAKAA